MVVIRPQWSLLASIIVAHYRSDIHSITVCGLGAMVQLQSRMFVMYRVSGKQSLVACTSLTIMTVIYTMRDLDSYRSLQTCNNNGSDLLHFERSRLLLRPTSLQQ